MELININFLQRQKKIELDGKRQGGILGAFLLGLTFSFGWTPCVGPVLGAVLAVVASENGSALYGGLLMAVYAAGMACLLYTSPSPRDGLLSRMPPSA